jgi:Ca2+-transporting ATPase
MRTSVIGVKPKHSSEEVLQKWRNLCGVVKNPKRRFRFTANLSKRYEAAAMRRTNQASLLSLNLFHFISTKYTKKHNKLK